MGKKKFSKDFKMQVLRELESGKTPIEISREKQIHSSLIRRWKMEYKRDPEHAFSGKGNPSKENTVIAQLERKIGQLYLQNEFLKKAVDTLQARLAEARKGV